MMTVSTKRTRSLAVEPSGGSGNSACAAATASAVGVLGPRRTARISPAIPSEADLHEVEAEGVRKIAAQHGADLALKKRRPDRGMQLKTERRREND